MPDRQSKSYKIVTLSMYLSDLAEADRVTEALRRAGWPKANRSLVVREALLGLHEDLATKSDEDIFQFFLSRHRKRGASRGTHQPASPPDALPEPDE